MSDRIATLKREIHAQRDANVLCQLYALLEKEEEMTRIGVRP